MPTPDYLLHKLGWRDFQDLCSVVLQEVFGQHFTTFADSNDGGRDGAFQGIWTHSHPDTPEYDAMDVTLPTVVQCKFSKHGDKTLVPSDVTGELKKAESLHSDGRCENYVLMTNLHISGKTEAKLREYFGEIGISNLAFYDGKWINTQISKQKILRRYVPRVYGLGDLGLIFDDRRFDQARALLADLKPELQTFVPTDAYRRAAKSLADNGLIVLTGAPASGKSTIAAVLSVAALDEFDCEPIRLDSASDFVDAWDPSDPNRLFWVDDAFGPVRFDEARTQAWVSVMDRVKTAQGEGARFIFTSRSYIYRRAQEHLKLGRNLHLRDAEIVIDIEGITTAEREAILYNHLVAGDQVATTLSSWRPHLKGLARLPEFQPETARRLGLKAFASEINSRFELERFVRHPLSLLAEVVEQLDSDSKAALTAIYIGDSKAEIPFHFSEPQRRAAILLQSSEAGAVGALDSLNGNFLRIRSDSDERHFWEFQHPTIREGLADFLGSRPNLIEIYLEGLTLEELLTNIDCGGTEEGKLVIVPASLYADIAQRIPLPPLTRDSFGISYRTQQFLLNRASSHFLHKWWAFHKEVFSSVAEDFPEVSGLLHSIGLLPDRTRLAVIESLRKDALEDSGTQWLERHSTGLFTRKERDALLGEFSSTVLESIPDQIEQAWADKPADMGASDFYEPEVSILRAIEDSFPDDDAVQDLVMQGYSAYEDMQKKEDADLAAEEERNGQLYWDEWHHAAAPRPSHNSSSIPSMRRDRFDDVHLGRE